MAPELLLESTGNTAMSDIYAFGILLYEVYSGQQPYEGEIYEDVINAVSDPAIRKRPPVPPLCPPTVGSLMVDCLRHSPEERPSTKELDSMLQAEGTVQGRIVRIAALNKNLVEENRQISSEQATQLGHFACMSHEIRYVYVDISLCLASWSVARPNNTARSLTHFIFLFLLRCPEPR